MIINSYITLTMATGAQTDKALGCNMSYGATTTISFVSIYYSDRSPLRSPLVLYLSVIAAWNIKELNGGCAWGGVKTRPLWEPEWDSVVCPIFGFNGTRALIDERGPKMCRAALVNYAALDRQPVCGPRKTRDIEPGLMLGQRMRR